MAEVLKPALVGDSNQVRFDWLREFLEREFGVEAVQAKSFTELRELVVESFDPEAEFGLSNYSIIFVADDFPMYPKKIGTPEIVKGHFRSLNEIDKVDMFLTVLIVGRSTLIDFRGVISPKKQIRISTVPLKPDDPEYKDCVKTLEHFGGLEIVTSAALLWDQNNRSLREQIRALSDLRKLSEGEEHLACLISRCLDCKNLPPIEVREIGQGKSGASVFRILIDRGGTAADEYLLKLCSAGSVWKLESEVRGHLRARSDLTHPDYLVNLPVLRTAHVASGSLGTSGQPNHHIVRSAQWYGVHFDFIGGDRFGDFIDLETTLIGSAKEFEEKTALTSFSPKKSGDANLQRNRIFETLLDWLCATWYANPKSADLRREEKQMWNSGDAKEQEYIVMPPYKLTGRSKRWIQSFLDSREAALGERFFSDWEEHSERVLRLVSEDDPAETDLGQLGLSLPVVLSHVHGDLNAANMLLWLDKEHPFLIDFPFYQKAGHALQDFARLEVEIKLALMDRQKDSSAELKAYEYTYSQMPIWKQMEDRLLADWDKTPADWHSDSYTENVQFCFALIQVLRRKALKVQQNDQCPGPGGTNFLSEYLPALLYHTVRSIGFPSLSVFKRLLAVYSAGSILKKLNCFPGASKTR